jgi:hypothetical protein
MNCQAAKCDDNSDDGGNNGEDGTMRTRIQRYNKDDEDGLL